jgi:apurinic endonuclease (APN1)
VKKDGKKHKLLLGAHMSISGGLENAILSGQEIGCTAIAMFTKSNRQWGAKNLTMQEILAFKSAWKNSDIIDIVAHCTYLINIGSPNAATYKKSKITLGNELKICQELGINYLVLHPGARLTSSVEECLERISQALDEILENDPKSKVGSLYGGTKILIETMAGQGTGVGHTFEQIASIFDQCKHKKRLGVALDTCHIFAAGYDFRSKKDYENMIQEFDNIIGLKNLHAIHINDSKKDLGSKVDRHEEIGDGKLGLEPFRFIFNDERLFDVPKILETPVGTLESYAHNMQVIRGLLSPETKKILGV